MFRLYQPVMRTSLAIRHFATRKTRRPTRKPAVAPPPPAMSLEQAWSPVTDPASGGIYYWNKITNETTHVGAPNPALEVQQQSQSNAVAEPQQGGGMMSGLGGMVAQGMAFGAGSSIAHHAVGSMFGGSGSGSDSGHSDQGGDQGGGGGGFDDGGGDFDL